MPTNKVKWFTGSRPSEIYQSFNMKFAFANETDNEIIQCHQWVKCRDFLHDVVRTMLTGAISSIYSFQFEKGKNPDMCMDNIKLLVSKKDIKTGLIFRPILNRSLKLINHFENLAGEELSTLRKVQADNTAGYKHVWLVTGPKFWLSTPYLVSLYTFLLRLGDKKFKFKDGNSLKKAFEKECNKQEADGGNDSKYLKQVWDKIDRVIEAHDQLAELNDDGFSSLYFDKASISDFHNRTGIVSACKGSTWNTKFNKSITKVLSKEK